MPLYDYKCSECQHEMKLFHGVNEGTGKCPKCCNDSLKKQFLRNGNVIHMSSNDSAGSRIEKFIEESREVLREQMAEARKEIEK